MKPDYSIELAWAELCQAQDKLGLTELLKKKMIQGESKCFKAMEYQEDTRAVKEIKEHTRKSRRVWSFV